MTAYLTIRNLAKSYGRATALQRIDMEIDRGAFLTLLGPSGSGKTTLLRILAGLLEPDRGALVLDGRDITRVPAWDRDIGLVFQNYALFPHMDARANVGFGLEMRGIRGTEAARRIDEALDMVSMRDYGARRPSELSGGQQQRIAIARRHRHQAALAVAGRTVVQSRRGSAPVGAGGTARIARTHRADHGDGHP